MNAARPNTLVVDFSVLPSRPDPAAAEEFIMKKVNLVLEDTTTIQYHNIDRRFYIQMKDSNKALLYQRTHNCHHQMTCKDNGKLYRIPVFYLDGASSVRLHDLPPTVTAASISEHMRQYGTVVAVSRERWKNYFGGFHNGVWCLRIYLNKPIPSYVCISGFQTLCTHSGSGEMAQIKTCRFCAAPLHPNSKCTTNPASSSSSSSSQQALSPQDFPSLPKQRDQTQTQPQKGINKAPPITDLEEKKMKTQQHLKQHDHATDTERMELDLESENKVIENKKQSTNTSNISSIQLPSAAGIEIRNFFIHLSDSEENSVSKK